MGKTCEILIERRWFNKNLQHIWKCHKYLYKMPAISIYLHTCICNRSNWKIKHISCQKKEIYFMGLLIRYSHWGVTLHVPEVEICHPDNIFTTVHLSPRSLATNKWVATK